MTMLGTILRRGLTPQQIFASGYEEWANQNTSSGIRVTTSMAMKAAQGACVRLLADDISALPLDFFRKVGDERIPIPAPSWYLYPTFNKWDTFVHHVSQVVVSVGTDGNAFIRAFPNTMDAEYLYVWDPNKVDMRTEGGRTTFKFGGDPVNGITAGEFGDGEIVHIPWVTLPGSSRGLNPIQGAQESTGLELAAREWASRFFSNGATVGGVIQIPREAGVLSKEAIDELRNQFANKQQGRRKSWAFGVLQGGAQWVPNTIKPAEADLAPLWRHVMEEAARIYHIPPHLLASQEPGAQGYASVEHRSIEYVQHAVVPIVRRLEAAYSRLVPGDDTFVRFNVNALLRGDIKTRAEAYQFFVQNKVMRPSEVRTLEDLPPDPENTGYLETPNNNAPAPTPASGSSPND